MGKVKITEHHFLKRSRLRSYVFDTSDFQLKFSGSFGFGKIKEKHADLLDIALAIYHFEKIQSRHGRTNPVVKVEMEIWLRKPELWNEENLDLLASSLTIMGNAEWTIRFHQNRSKDVYTVEKAELNIEKVVLFSGGIDSTAGIATLPKEEIENVLLFSYYSKQKTLQKDIAKALGFSGKDHVQFWYKMTNKEVAGKNRSFFYRSVLFLFLASVLADSHNCPKVLQFENGILATSIPPTPSLLITRHANPVIHHRFSKLMSNIFEKEFNIQNPFLPFTKRECVEKAYAAWGREKFDEILESTETCWFKYSNFDIRGKKKKNNSECGFCIPCIIKRTAVPGADFLTDLNSKKGTAIRNDQRWGEGFRSYFAFTKKIMAINSSSRTRLADFYRILPATGRSFFDPKVEFPFEDPPDIIYRLFRKFAEEFHQTFT